MGRFKITKDTADIDCRVKIAENDEADGTIIRQKGAKKFLVTDGTNTGICILSDIDDGNLANGTMTVCITHSNKEVRLEYLSNKYGVDFEGNRYALSVSESSVLDNCVPATLNKSSEKKPKVAEKSKAKPKAKPKLKPKATKKKITPKKKVEKKPTLKSVPKINTDKIDTTKHTTDDASKTTSNYETELN